MGTIQIIGLSIFSIFVLIFIISHISMLQAWKNIEIGDTGMYTTEDGWHNIVWNIEVVEKYKDYIIIKHGDDTKETIYKYEYMHHDKNFKWDKYGETD